MSELVGAWLGIFLTMCILSFLYGDNPFYKLAEHLFVGVSIGYVVVVEIKSNFYVKLERGLTPWDLVPALLVALMFVKLGSRRLAWLGRFPLAFVVALFAAQSITGLVGADLGDQMKAASHSLLVHKLDVNTASASELSQIPGVTPAIAQKIVADRAGGTFASLDDAIARLPLTASERADLDDARGPLLGLDARAAASPGEIDWFGVASQVLLLVALLSALLYFYFSVAHDGAIGRASRVGVWFVMIGFGATFGWTVQGRIAVAIARVQDIRSRSHGEVAALVSAAVIAVGIWLWERNRTSA